ncbi:MAG: methyltransferase domain-containing protein, partial [Pseudomonadota bacterium]
TSPGIACPTPKPSGLDIPLQFDAKAAAFLDRNYQGSDITRRRRASFDALRPGPGETIVDIGCGNGFLTVELARAVGDSGRVVGVDLSAPMLASARDRCAGFDWVEFHEAPADAMPLADGAAHKAVSIQVFEYIPDLAAALAEVHRVLKPGGRAVISDFHYDTFVWHSADPDRMARMLASSSAKVLHKTMAVILPPLLREAGFAVDSIEPVTFCDHQLRADGIAAGYLTYFVDGAIANGHLSDAEAHAWRDEQLALAQAGQFFFSATHFVVAATKR